MQIYFKVIKWIEDDIFLFLSATLQKEDFQQY